jgi:hypothetical protein
MSAGVRWVADRRRREQPPQHRVRSVLTSIATIGIGVVVVVVAALTLWRTPLPGPQTVFTLTAGVENATPEELTTAAADVLVRALAPGGGGIEFEIVQSSTIAARPGGPLVEIPDPTDRGASLGFAERYALGTLVQRGFATPDGYWMEMIHGPQPGAEADYKLEEAQVAHQALVRESIAYRNDGEGWHPTDLLPGMGLDPATVALLPTMLTDATESRDVPLAPPTEPRAAEPATTDPLEVASGPLDPAAIGEAIDGLKGPEQPPVRALEAMTTVADIPGIIAVDLAEATEITTPAKFAFDDAGRLVTITILARNTLLEVHDLLVETVITFRYPTDPPDLPKPEPTYVEPAPADGEGE